MVAQLAAGLEVPTLTTYKAAAAAATAGKLGPVPPAVAQYLTTALGQHQRHVVAWNKVLTSAGKPEMTTLNATLKSTMDSEIAHVKDVAGVADFARKPGTDRRSDLPQGDAHPQRQRHHPKRGANPSHRPATPGNPALRLGMYPVPEVFQAPIKPSSSRVNLRQGPPTVACLNRPGLCSVHRPVHRSERSDMMVSEIFTMGRGCGHGGEWHRSSYDSCGSCYHSGGYGGGRFSYGYYNGYNRGGFRNGSFSRGGGLLGILG